MYKKNHLLTVAVFVVILLVISLACSLPFSGAKDVDSGAGSAVEFGGENDGGSDGDTEMADGDSGGEAAMETGAEADMSSDSDGNAGVDQPETPFPLTDDADILVQDSESYTYSTKLSIQETIDFYRQEFDKLGLSERDLLTAISDDSFSMVFDGHSNGQAIVVQGTDFGDSATISIRFEDI